MLDAVLYCTVLYCTVLYCTVLYCTVLYCTVLYCTVLYYVLYCTVLYCTVLYCTVLYCTVLYCTVQCTHPANDRAAGAIVSARNPNSSPRGFETYRIFTFFLLRGLDYNHKFTVPPNVSSFAFYQILRTFHDTIAQSFRILYGSRRSPHDRERVRRCTFHGTVLLASTKSRTRTSTRRRARTRTSTYGRQRQQSVRAVVEAWSAAGRPDQQFNIST